MELKDLVGRHKLSGCDIGIIAGAEFLDEDAAKLVFILDGVTLVATEDPSDGYRSHFKELFVASEDICKNVFEPIEVIGQLTDRMLDLIDVHTHKSVISIGTNYLDDYYPCCVLSFDPKAMVTNA